MWLLNNRKVTGNCYNCEYRHLICGYPSPYETNKPCVHWKLGGCYNCIYNKENMTEEELRGWLERGCEGLFPSRGNCKKFRRNWKKLFYELKRVIERMCNN